MGDRISRGWPLKMSLMMMAVPTILIGCLPTYHELLHCFCILIVNDLSMGLAYSFSVEFTLNNCNWHYAARNKMFPNAKIRGFRFCITHAKTVIVKNSSDHLIFNCLQSDSYYLYAFLPVSFLGLPGTLGAVNKYFCFNHINTFFSILWIHCSICWTSTMFKIGIVATLLLICPLWFLLQKPSFGAILTSQLLLALLFGHMSGIIMEMLGLQFRHFVRCRGMNLAYTFPIAIWGGTAPLVNTWMIQKTGLLLFPAFYIMLFGLLALPAEWRLRTVED